MGSTQPNDCRHLDPSSSSATYCWLLRTATIAHHAVGVCCMVSGIDTIWRDASNLHSLSLGLADGSQKKCKQR